MNSGIDKLKEIGAQKIHEQTHVPKGHIQAILHNSFEDLNKVQIIGFISILEREYKVDLSDIRDSANNYFDQFSGSDNDNKEIFIAVREKKNSNNIIVYIIIFLVLAIALYFSLKDSSVENENVDNALIEDIKEKVVQEENITKKIIKTDDLNVTKNIDEPKEEKKVAEAKEIQQVKEKKEPKKIVKSLKILPKSKVWVGYIEIDNNKHHQLVVKNSLELNSTKDWLILFGHNQIEFEIDGKKKDFGDKIRFSYIDAELKPISLKEFKKLNKGSKW